MTARPVRRLDTRRTLNTRGQPYQDLGADFYTRRESPEQRQAWPLRQLRKLNPGATITITPPESCLTPCAT